MPEILSVDYLDSSRSSARVRVDLGSTVQSPPVVLYVPRSGDTGPGMGYAVREAMLFDASGWTIDGPRSMSFALVTDDPAPGETTRTAFTATWTARRESDLCGILWHSADKYSHGLQRRETVTDYTGVVLAFTVEQDGDMFAFDGDHGLTLTINCRQGDAVVPYYVRLANYAADATATGGSVVIDFDTVKGGFEPDVDIPVTAIDSLFIAGVTVSYGDANMTGETPGQGDSWSAPLAEHETAALRISGITCNRTIRQHSVNVPPHDLGISTGYDDSYNICPKVLVDQLVQLGYHRVINHYCGMSHYYEQYWDEGLGRFVVPTTGRLLNEACIAWHRAFAEAAQHAGMEILFAISYELFSEAAVVDWMQRDWDGNLGITGYIPPSYLISPCIESGMAWLREVFVQFAQLLDAAGLPVIMQVGEPWWWFNTASRKPCVYDYPTRLKFNADTGLFAPEFETINDMREGTPYTEFREWLRDQLGESVLSIRAAVKAAYPDAAVSALFFLPSILDPRVGIINTINYPAAHYAYPNLDFFQSEAYDWLIEGEYHQALRAFSLPVDELGYPPELVHYLAGFVPDQALGEIIIPGYDLARQGLGIWRAIFGNIKAGANAGIGTISIWAHNQIYRDSIVYHPDQHYNSFYYGRREVASSRAAMEGTD